VRKGRGRGNTEGKVGEGEREKERWADNGIERMSE
jgi:hypothetical protein